MCADMYHNRVGLKHPGRGLVALALLAVTLSACGFAKQLTRPEGDGGWSSRERQDEIATRARTGGVDLGTGGIPKSDAQPAAAPAPATHPLTLDDALRLANTGNRRIAESAQQVERARQQVWNTRGLLLPQTTAGGRYTWYSDPLTNSATTPNPLPPPDTIQSEIIIREDHAGTVNGAVTLPFDISGELRHALAAAQAGYRGERARRWATVLDEQVAVANAYFDMLQTQRLHEVTEQTIAAQRRQLDSAEARYSSGRTTKNDLLVVQVTLQSTEQRLLLEDLLLARARLSLNQTIGLPVNAPTTVVDVRDVPVVPGVEQALAETWTRNPLILARLEEQQRLENIVTSLQRSRLPRFGGGGEIDWTSSDIVEPQDVASGFVGFSWDLGTDWRRESEIAGAQAAAEQNRIAMERDMRAVEAGVRLTAQAVQERLSAYDAARASVAQAEENLRIREQQFDVGRATSDDVLTAVTLLARERAIAATALYEAHTRAAQLRQLMGLPIAGVSPEDGAP